MLRRSSRVQKVVIDSGELWVLTHLNCSQSDEDLGDCVNTTAATLVNFHPMNVSTLSCTGQALRGEVWGKGRAVVRETMREERWE